MRYYLGRTRHKYYEVRWTEPGGNGRSSSLGTQDKGVAKERLDQFVAEHSKSVGTLKTINSVCETYFNAKKKIHKDSGESLSYCLKPVKELLGNLRPDQVGNDQVVDYYTERNKADSTVLTELKYLLAALRWCHKIYKIDIQEFDMPCGPSPARDKWLTKDEARKLLECAASNHIRLFIVMAITTGQRSISICQLPWMDDAGKTGVHWDKGYIDFGERVGKKDRSTVPINEMLRRQLEIAYQIHTTDYVIEWNGNPVKDVRGGLSAAARRAGLGKLGKHCLRHTAATWMVMEKRTFEEVAKYLGTTKEMIESTYGHHHPDYLREASSTLEF